MWLAYFPHSNLKAETAVKTNTNHLIRDNTASDSVHLNDWKAVEPLMLEYFENGDCEEVLFSLE